MSAQVCVICNGRGVVRGDFYEPSKTSTSVNVGEVTCKTCSGTGILWPPGDYLPRREPPVVEPYKNPYRSEPHIKPWDYEHPTWTAGSVASDNAKHGIR